MGESFDMVSNVFYFYLVVACFYLMFSSPYDLNISKVLWWPIVFVKFLYRSFLEVIRE